MHPIQAALRRASESDLMPAGASLLLAVSGGADSLALLHAAAEEAPAARWRPAVAHVHHGWRGREADRDLSFVRDHARRLELPFLWRRRDGLAYARAARVSPEAGAREVRYAALAEMAREAGAERIVTAHQADDRIESHLLARRRGGGLAALAGPRRRRADGVVRPLLEVSRAEVLDFLDRRRLSHRRDASNGDLRLARNRLRRELGSQPAGIGRQERSELLAEIDELERQRDRLEQEVARTVWPHASVGPGAAAIDARFLASCPLPLQRRALEELAAPFAAPGLAPLTGPEREQVLRRLAEGSDFRFEAGRRIRIERRGPLLTFRPRESRGGTPYSQPV